jgi:prepilin-type N-terminal cleavage/methylation domain-containing protein
MRARFPLFGPQSGFTLIELMIVVTIIGILATIAVPYYRGYVRQAHLAEAKPYLLDIASKERSYKVRNGLYCCASSNLSEANLTSGLNVDLNGTGNFCFVVICRDSTLCTTTNSTNFISTSQGGDPTVEFEVWAILRATSTTSVTGPSSTTCTMPAAKPTPTGWVQTSGSGQPGREGRAVVYRYPPPPNRRDTAAGTDSIFFSWLEGLSESDALQ